MNRNSTLRSIFLVFFVLFFSFQDFAQIAAWDFTGEASPATSAADVYNSNLDASNLLTRGTGAASSAATNSFRTVGFKNDGISTANTDYFQFTLSANSGYTLSLSTLDAKFAGTASFAVSPGVTSQFAYSLDGVTYTLIATPVAAVGTPATMPQVDVSSVAALQNVTAGTTVTIRYYASGQTATGGWGFTSPATGQYGLAVGGSVNLISTAAPTKLVVTSVSPASPTANNAFSVTVQSQDNANVAQNVSANTNVTLSVSTGTGTLSGTVTGSIPAGSNSVVISGVLYNTAENGVIITAARTSGDVLSSGNSTSFNVLAQASQLSLVNAPTSGTATTNVSSFTVEARRPDNTADNTYTGNISISKTSGPGTLTGTLTKAAVNGVATFSDLKFDQEGTYTITATSGSLTSVTSGNIVIAPAPVQVIAGQVLINQFNPGYSGAGDEYIELVNTTGNAIDLSTLKIVYQAASGGTGSAGGVLSGTLLPNSFWLLSPNAAVTIGQTTALARDGSIGTGFAATAGQFALERVSDNAVIDGFAYGTITGGTLGEGTPASAPSSNSGYKRATDGADNNMNSTDFSSVAFANIYLRNSLSRLANTGASIAAGNYTNLVVTGNSSLAGAVTVSQLLDVTGGNFNTNNTLTLTSNAANTARVGQITGTVTGTATVERFIPARRAWRLLNAPLVTSSTQTVKAAWQEGGSNAAGFGTQITGGTASAGFDQSPANSSSIKVFDQSSQVFNALPSTLSALKSQPGYFMFVRGDRIVDLSQGSAAGATSTVLRANGTLKTGDTTITVAPAGFTLLGNPYASPVDFNLLTRLNVINRFYAWDPSLNTVGGYVTVDDETNTGTYTVTPTSSQTKILQSGQAFFVLPSAAAASVTFTESSKSAATGNSGFRTNSGNSEVLRTSLYLKNTDSTTILADGVVAEYNNASSSSITLEDALKMPNINENLAIERNERALSIERRPLIDENDTLFLHLTNTTTRDYTFQFEPSNISSVVSAWLEDAYLKTSTPVSVTAPTNVDFSVTSNTASADASRFRIVFKISGALPLSAIDVKAYQQNGGIQVDWNIATESNMKQYEVEKSADGQDFKKVGTAAATGNNNAAASYNWFDATPLNGSNFYRIKAVAKTGEVTYSQVVNVKVGNGKSDIVVFPNPVQDRTITLQFSNQPKGTYTVQLFSALGQQMLTKTIVHIGGSATQTIRLGSLVSKGVYQLQVSNGDNKLNQQVIVQ